MICSPRTDAPAKNVSISRRRLPPIPRWALPRQQPALDRLDHRQQIRHAVDHLVRTGIPQLLRRLGAQRILLAGIQRLPLRQRQADRVPADGHPDRPAARVQAFFDADARVVHLDHARRRLHAQVGNASVHRQRRWPARGLVAGAD